MKERKAGRVVVVSMDHLPGASYMGSGAGLRAWCLGEGLRSRGFSVTYLVPAKERKHPPCEAPVREYTLRNLDAVIRRCSPDVVVFQNWGRLPYVGRFDVPVVIDFHGPSVIEMEIMKNPLLWLFKRVKLESIAKADYFTCAGEGQKKYFLAWLFLAGVQMTGDPIGVVPLCMPPTLPVWEPAEELTFVHGGHFVPWVDTSRALLACVEFLEAKGSGRLKVFGNKHPGIGAPDDSIDRLLARLGASPAVDLSGMIPADEVTERYRRCHVAIDLQKKNPERLLAFTTRTVHYLWCGLPVIYNNYADLSGYIERYDAGWTLDPEDMDGLGRVFDEISSSPDVVRAKSRNAQRLVAERLTWDKAIEDLATFCAAPFTREKKETPVTRIGLTKRIQETLWTARARARLPVTPK